jgi:hypothetical protein
MSRDGKWTYNDVDDGIWSNDDFETEEEAVKYGREATLDEENDCFYIGQIVPFVPSVDAAMIIDSISENACEECGESADGYLDYVDKKDIAKLAVRLNEVLDKWLTDTGNEPTFWKIENIKQIEV